MFKLSLTSFFCLLIAFSANLFAENSQLKVGIIAPLTGGVANWGQSVLAAIELANTHSKHKAKLYIEDEQTCSTTSALSAYRNLTSVKKVDIIVTSCLEGGQAIAPLALKSNIPLFISGRSSKDFQAKNPNATSWLSLLDYEGEAIVKLSKDREWKNGRAMVWSGYFGVQFASSIKNAIKQFNPKFKFKTIQIAQGSSPEGAEIQRLIKDNPDVVFLMTSEPAAAYIVKQLKLFKYSGDIVMQSSMLQTRDPAVRKDFVDVIQQKFSINEVEFNKLSNIIQKKLEDSVADDFIFSYDGFSILLDEASSCMTNKPQKLNDCLKANLRNEKWRNGVSGKFRFLADGSIERPMHFKSVTISGFSNLE